MGYRSSMAIAIRKKDIKQYISTLPKISLDLITEAKVTYKGNHIIFQWSGEEWDERREDIKALKNNLPDIYCFIRIGEDFNDIEFNYNDIDFRTEEQDREIAFGVMGINRNIVV